MGQDIRWCVLAMAECFPGEWKDVCVCEGVRERERERVCVCVIAYYDKVPTIPML